VSKSSSLRDIFIVGRSCRLPGAADVGSFWRNLAAGRASIREIGADRWDVAHFHHPRLREPGRSYTFKSGTIDNVWGFDAAAFGISPREALQMDPQQRLALELVAEALEDGLILPSAIAAGQVGVYAGASGLDHSTARMFDAASADAYFMIGNTLSLISNRVSHAFDLRGPSLTIDTACSSSLVALHHACEALRAGSVEMAVVVGVNMLLSPFPFIGFSQASMLAPDGACRPFDADGRGYVRSEGGVALILTRGDSALVETPRRYARIVATGVNSDGRTVGVSLPSAEQQARLLEDVYGASGVRAGDLAFVEAHGTGTRAGDPAEAAALGRVLGQRREAALPIGSVKSNIGHLEPASGVAGLLKAVLALEHDLLPASLNFATPNPEIPFRDLNLRVAHKAERLPRGKRERFAGISTFGFGGTNAHVIIADAKAKVVAPRRASRRADGGPMLVLSAMTVPALQALAGRHAEMAAGTGGGDRAVAVARARDLLPERAVFLAEARDELVDDLKAFAEGAASDRVVQARAAGGAHARTQDAPKIAFVFSGNGSQWAGMGRAAYERNAAFKAAFDEVDALFAPRTGWSLREALSDEGLEQRLASTLVAQPLLFAVQVALARALAAVGVTPHCTAGHSVGEIAAAHVAGALPLETAVRIIEARSACQEPMRGAGVMAAVRLGANDARATIASLGLDDDVEIAAVNSAGSVTVVGTREGIEAFQAHAQAAGTGVRVLDIAYPFHSRIIETARRPLLKALAGLEASASAIPFVSTVTGGVLDGASLDAGYWWRNVRAPVQFRDAIAAAVRNGARLFVEIGPRPVLQSYLGDCLPETGETCAAIATLTRDDAGDLDPVRAIFAKLLAYGVRDPRAHEGPMRAVPLPAYPWQRETYRAAETPEAVGQLQGHAGQSALLGWQAIGGDLSWRTYLDAEALPWLADHRVNGRVVFPGAGFAEMALAATRVWLGADAVEIRDMDLVHPLVLEDGQTREVRIQVMPDTGAIDIASRPRLGDGAFETHARCHGAKLAIEGAVPVTAGRAKRMAGAGDVYAAARRHGLDYGPAFRRVAELRRLDETSFEAEFTASRDGGLMFGLDPADLDAAFHGLFVLSRTSGTAPRDPFVPVRFGALRLHKFGAAVARARLDVGRANSRSIQTDVTLFDKDGGVIAVLSDARFASAPLFQTWRLEDLTYHEALVPLRMDAHRHEPVDFAALHAAADAQAEAANDARWAEPYLLLEAAARQAAREALNSAGAESEGDAGVLRPALDMHRWSEEDGAAMPPAADILRTIMAQHPAWAADATLLASAAAELKARLARTDDEGVSLYTAATRDHFQFGSPRHAWAAPAVAALVQTARAGRIAVLGCDDRLVRLLAARADAQIVIVESDHRALNRARLDFEREPRVRVIEAGGAAGWLGADGPFDAIVSTGLHRLKADATLLGEAATALAPGGALICAAPHPDAFHDVVFGLDAGWFDRSIDAAFPVGVLRTVDEWQGELTAAGLRQHHVVSVGGEQPLGVLAVAAAHASVAPQFVKGASHDGPHKAAVQVAGTVTADIDALRTRLQVRLGFAPVWTNGHGGGDDAGGAVQDNVLLVSADAGLQDVIEHLTAAVRSAAQAGTRLWVVCGQDTPVASAVRAAARTAANEYADLEIRVVEIGGRCPIVPSPLEGEGQGGGDRRAVEPESSSVSKPTNAGIPPTPDPSPQGGGGFFTEAEDAADRLAEIVSQAPAEREIVIGASGVSARRVRRGGRPPTGAARKGKAAWGVLGQGRRGQFDTLTWQAVPARAPAAGEIVLKVAASGLNFRDVMWAQGLLPEEALEDGFAGPSLGFECAGEVVATGAGVTDLKTGDTVMALAADAFATHVVVPASAAIGLPESIDATAAATVPVAFMSAYYALEHLARLREGEWVLIHGGAGGVGLAALQIAQRRGARTILTAGTEEKRALLTLLGADHVLSSRSLAFGDEVMGITGGKGVDVVLNSLAGEAMELSLRLVKAFGRFIELGKRDYYANTKVGLRPFRRNVSYFGVDLDQLVAGQPELAKELMGELAALCADETFRPLPYRAFEAGRISDAFRLMQQSGHIGKIVVTPPQAGEVMAAKAARPMRVDGAGWHVVTGGTSGFGLATAGWLADRGARRIALVSRSGRAAGEAQSEVEALRARGIDVETFACDVADAQALGKLLAKLRKARPIKGIVHAAMVLDDALMANLDAERIATVLRPKADGAANLDRLTRGDRLDYFLLYSSVTTLFGNAGQAAYVAANAYLEGLAQQRRAEGLPALAVRWGAIGDTGVLARNAKTGAELTRRAGATSLWAREALDMLAAAMAEAGADDEAVLTVAPIDWGLAAAGLAVLKTPLFGDIRAAREPAAASDALDLDTVVPTLDDAAALALIARHLKAEMGAILRLAPEDIDARRSLADLGMDSLMAMELRLAVHRKLGIELPITAVADGLSVEAVGRKVLARIRSRAVGTGVQQDLAEKHAAELPDAERLQTLIVEIDRTTTAREAAE
jgi:acyl transferase domain-containing protein/NADPH:quinone reductase-like Zn-dependent oxidoreductase/acyl carrier protein